MLTTVAPAMTMTTTAKSAQWTGSRTPQHRPAVRTTVAAIVTPERGASSDKGHTEYAKESVNTGMTPWKKMPPNSRHLRCHGSPYS
eukprot:3853500-Prymnesium_polylepis.1